MSSSYSDFTCSHFNEIEKYWKTKDNKVDLNKAILYDLTNFSNDTPKASIKNSCLVSVLNIDSFDAAKILIDKYNKKPLVLNMASNIKPCGGFRKGSVAQEEVMCYKSTYAMNLEKMKDSYPLNTYDVIYSPDVFVFLNNDYNLLEYKDCFMTSCIAVAGLRKPTLVNNKLNSRDREITKRKIEGIFKVAIKHGHKTMVLGAIGCGVFQNPPEDIATEFAMAIKKYGHLFTEIIFAVLVVKPKDGNNLLTFQRILS